MTVPEFVKKGLRPLPGATEPCEECGREFCAFAGTPGEPCYGTIYGRLDLVATHTCEGHSEKGVYTPWTPKTGS